MLGTSPSPGPSSLEDLRMDSCPATAKGRLPLPLWAASLGWGRGAGTVLDGETRRDGPFCVPLLIVSSCLRLVLCLFYCVCFLDVATKEMEKPCPISEGDRLALSNVLFKLHPGCGV